MSHYTIQFLPTGSRSAESVKSFDSYASALKGVITHVGKSEYLYPLDHNSVAALAGLKPLQAWSLNDSVGDRVGILFVN